MDEVRSSEEVVEGSSAREEQAYMQAAPWAGVVVSFWVEWVGEVERGSEEVWDKRKTISRNVLRDKV